MSNWHMPSTYDAGGAMGPDGRAANGATVKESGERNNLAGVRKLKLRMPRTRECQESENITEASMTLEKWRAAGPLDGGNT